MKKASLKYVNIALIAVVILLLTVRIYDLKRTNFDIDNLSTQLAPFSKHLKPYSKIGFVDSTQNATSVMEIEYLMLPHIIVSNLSPDTLLLVQPKGGKIKFPVNYKTIEQREYDDKVFLLAIKAK